MKLSKLEAVRELWSKKRPLGKFHNMVSFIRKTPQRREAFLAVVWEQRYGCYN
jgi:hypothetical protein